MIRCELSSLSQSSAPFQADVRSGSSQINPVAFSAISQAVANQGERGQSAHFFDEMRHLSPIAPPVSPESCGVDEAQSLPPIKMLVFPKRGREGEAQVLPPIETLVFPKRDRHDEAQALPPIIDTLVFPKQDRHDEAQALPPVVPEGWLPGRRDRIDALANRFSAEFTAERKRKRRIADTESLIHAAKSGDIALVRKLVSHANYRFLKRQLTTLLKSDDIKIEEIKELIRNKLSTIHY
jgi:hypothetical protein